MTSLGCCSRLLHGVGLGRTCSLLYPYGVASTCYQSVMCPVAPLTSVLSSPIINSSSHSLHTSSHDEGPKFFDKRNAAFLWKSSTSVSNPGRKKGRASGLMKIRNLNRGQRLGMGMARIKWDGLNRSTFNLSRGQYSVNKVSADEFKKYQDTVIDIQTWRTRNLRRQTPLERGWTSKDPRGRYFLPPPNTDSSNMESFTSVLVGAHTRRHMKSHGRVRAITYTMVTGNKKGAAGFSTFRMVERRGPTFYDIASMRAARRLIEIPLYDGRTVFHDFYTAYGSCRLFVRQAPAGYGLKADKRIRSMCEVIGIKDIDVVMENGRYIEPIVKAFFLGLIRQRTHQAMADEKRLHLVEIDEITGYPTVVASPSLGLKVRTEEEIEPHECLDYEIISHEGHLPFIKSKSMISRNFEERDESKFQLRLDKKHTKHFYETEVAETAEFGKVTSHLESRFPECDSKIWPEKFWRYVRRQKLKRGLLLDKEVQDKLDADWLSRNRRR